jgi:dTDP-4-amino-4,6-dideoxygalactose transaminase
MVMIPLVDLARQAATFEPQLGDAILAVVRSGAFTAGEHIRSFEREFAAYLGVHEAIAVKSGTDALQLALRALGVVAGDEVITTPFAFVAASEAIAALGATPVFVDIDPASLNIDVNRIEPAITVRTKALLPVHLYGCPSEMTPILKIARAYGLSVVEDCSQCAGGSVDSMPAGTFGDVGCFSFSPSKNLGAIGDAGMLVTNHQELAARARSLRSHGGRREGRHEEVGVSSRLDEIQAAILRLKLRRLDDLNNRRRAAARHYEQLLDGTNILLPVEPVGTTHAYCRFTVQTPKRDVVVQSLKAAEIGAGIFYPVPLHLQPVYRRLGLPPGTFPHAEQAAKTVLSLPMFPELTWKERARVADVLLQIALERPTRQHRSGRQPRDPARAAPTGLTRR